MLDAHAKGEGFGFHVKSFLHQHVEHVAGAVARRQHHSLAAESLASRLHAHAAAFLADQAGHTGVEMHHTAGRLHGLAHGRHHRRQAIRANVRMGFHQNMWVCPVGHQPFKRFPDVAPLLASRVEFAVAVGARTTFSKTVVGFRIDDMLFVELGQIPSACPHVLAALQHHRPNSKLNELQRGVQPRRPCPHHNQAWRVFRELGPRPSWRRFFFSPIDQQLGLHGPTSRVPTLAQNAGLVSFFQRRLALLAQLTVDRSTQRLRIANVFWQHTDLDL